MEETLDAAIDRLFPGGTPRASVQPAAASAPTAQTPEAATPQMTALADQARDHYERALQAQREGNWALYGEEIKKLGEILQKMKGR
jgi:hypothetical protein